MKITRYLTAAALCILSAASCTKELMGPGLNNGPREMVLEAYPGDESPETKTVLGSDGKSIYWEEGDQISLFFGNGENGGSCFTTADGGETASFTGSINAFTAGGEGYTGETTYFWGVYPYKSTTTCDNNSITINIPSVQPGKAGTFAPGVNISVGRSENLKMGFYNVCTSVSFTVANEGITELLFKAKDGVSIVGDATVEFVSGKPAVVSLENGSDEVRIIPEEGEFVVGQKYYLEFIPITLDGFTATIYNNAGKEATFEYARTKEYARSVPTNVSNLDTRVGEWTARKGNITFADPNFKAYCVENFDTDKDGEISYAEAAVVEVVECFNQDITSMDEIRYFTALRTLYCPFNQLTSLDVSNNTELTDLNCQQNQLTSLDISKNTNLINLLCSGNQLTSLDVSENTALNVLFCESNQLASLDVSKNTALNILFCHSNQFTSLDVSKNTALKSLFCNNNQLTSLDVSKNTALTGLVCNNNQLTSLDVSKNTALMGLDCSNNLLTSLDVSKNTALTNLDCSNNLLTSLDVSKNTNLTYLDCSPMYQNLKTLYIYNGQEIDGITTGRSSDYIPSETIITDADPGTNEGFGDGEELDGDGNITFADPNFKAYCVQNFDTNKDGEISYAEAAGVKGIGCSSSDITSMDEIRYFTALTYLYCSYNQLTSLDVSKNTALLTLYCTNNQLTSLDVSNNAALTTLDCWNNQLTGLDVSKNIALEYLHCEWNQLTSLDIHNNTALTNLDCGGNQLSGLDVSKNTSMTELKCGCNQLTSIDVSMITTLNYLDCGSNQLTSLDVGLNTALTRLWCENNQFTSLDVSKNTALTELWCSNNQLTTLDVSNNTALKSLTCSPMNDGNGQNLLKTLYIYEGQSIRDITENRNDNYIPHETTIRVK